MKNGKSILFWHALELSVDPVIFRDALRVHGVAWLADQIRDPVAAPTALERARSSRPRRGYLWRNIGRTGDGMAHLALAREESNPDAVEVVDAYTTEALFTCSTTASGDLSFSFVPDEVAREADQLERAFQKERAFLTQPDLGSLFTKIILGRLSGVRVKPGTAVFLVPQDSRAQIEAINEAMSDSKMGCRFIAQDIGDDDVEQYGDPIKVSLLDEIKNLQSKADQMVVDAGDGKEIRFSTIEHRMQDASDALDKSKMFAEILQEKQVDIDAAIAKFKTTIITATQILAQS